MNLALWIVAGLLAVVFVATGVMKLTRSKVTLATSSMQWTEDYSAGTIRGIAVLELLGAVGLILPAILHVAPVLVPLAALGLAAIMIGAAYTHARRKENPMIIANLFLLALAAFVAWCRFGAYTF